MNMLKEKLLFDAGTAAYWSEDYKNALDSFNAILENKNTAYFYDANFARADVYSKMKKYDSAREDYTAVASTATMAKQYSTYNKAQCLIGDAHLEEKNMLKAMAAFNIIAAPAFAQDDTFAMKFPSEEAKAKYEKEMEASREWLEYAIYRAAYCASILGRNDDKAKMTEKYKKNFPEGRFIKDLGKLPPADPQYQQPATP
ncbi:hypothetical protein SDC9_164433 [bioreactor metagenome]|uniref:Tetratricopeptide repeat protein n=1 Tax=bioreactor metagenome TaxID=1076179 RepID=A0A645FYU7_9ZZZZ